jgi:hypothetical protein
MDYKTANRRANTLLARHAARMAELVASGMAREAASAQAYKEVTGNGQGVKAGHKSAGQCFACGRKLGSKPAIADTHEDQAVYVGTECYRNILTAGDTGWQPPKGGPRLWVLTDARRKYFTGRGML